MDLNLSGKKALVTGGSKGIGRAIILALEAEGVKVTNWDLEGNVDLTKKLIPKVPNVDIIIHNVGGGGTWTNADEVMEKNYGIMNLITKKCSYNPESVVVISSIYGKEKGPNPIFAAAKAAQIAYAKSMGREGMRWNVVCPGHINVGKKFPDKPKIIGQPEDVAGIVTFLCSDKAKHINGACITVDGGESHAF